MRYLLVLIITLTLTACHYYPKAQQAVLDHKLESLCIRDLVVSGVERIDIKTANGTCTVEANGYYN